MAQRPLPELVNDYLNHLLDSPRTQRTYQTGLQAFLEFLADRRPPASHSIRTASAGHGKARRSDRRQAKSPPGIDDISTDVLKDFQSFLAGRSTSRFTQRTYVASVVAFLNYALGQDWLPPTFSLERARAKLRQVTRRSAYPIPRPDPALPRLISYYDDLPLPDGEDEKQRRERLQILRSRAFVHLLYSSAGRLAEVAALNRKAVADGRRKEAIVTGKGDKERYIFITPDAQTAIIAYVTERKDTFEPLFISHGRDYGHRYSRVSLWRTIKQAAKRLGMDVSPHDFRHFRARQMLEQGAPLEAIQEILGHSDISTTRRVYAHYSKPSIRAIFERTTLTPREASRASETDDREQRTS